MSLLKLNSIFQEQAELRSEDFIDRRPQHSNDSRFGFNVPVPGFDFDSKLTTTPILDSISVPQSSLVNFNKNTFDSRVPKNVGIKISNINSYKGSIKDDITEVDFPAILSNINNQFYVGENNSKNLSWQNLYNNNHTPKNNPTYNGITPINYGSNVNRDKLDIRANNAQYSLFNWSRTAFLGLGEGEPYIVSKIPTENNDYFGTGRLTNAGSQEVPIIRALTDTVRLGKYLTSPSGIQFALRQNILGRYSGVESPVTDNTGWNYNTTISQQRFNRSYNPLSTLGAAAARLFGTTPNVLIRKDEPFKVSKKSYPPENLIIPFLNISIRDTTNVNLTFLDNSVGISDNSVRFPIALGNKARRGGPYLSGDRMTLAPMIKGNILDSTGKNTKTEDETLVRLNVEEIKEGMPFYFKDLRDNSYIFFRAYIDGLTENIAPSWAESNYVGRSESVYTYERASRDISFTLKLAAQTRDELQAIYKKMNKLTSLAYPQYDTDNYLGGNKVRMKPPLTKFRMGEMFGNKNEDLLGFIQTISYTIDQSSTWETESGRRVPKHISVSLTYKVIHGTVPNIETNFYGYKGEKYV